MINDVKSHKICHQKNNRYIQSILFILYCTQILNCVHFVIQKSIVNNSI